MRYNDRIRFNRAWGQQEVPTRPCLVPLGLSNFGPREKTYGIKVVIVSFITFTACLFFSIPSSIELYEISKGKWEDIQTNHSMTKKPDAAVLYITKLVI